MAHFNVTKVIQFKAPLWLWHLIHRVLLCCPIDNRMFTSDGAPHELLYHQWVDITELCSSKWLHCDIYSVTVAPHLNNISASYTTKLNCDIVKFILT